MEEERQAKIAEQEEFAEEIRLAEEAERAARQEERDFFIAEGEKWVQEM